MGQLPFYCRSLLFHRVLWFGGGLCFLSMISCEGHSKKLVASNESLWASLLRWVSEKGSKEQTRGSLWYLSMCCTFNAVDAVCTAWHALAPFHESRHTAHFCIYFAYLRLLVYLCMCVYVYGFLYYVGPGNWTQSLGLASGIFTYWLSSWPHSHCTETRAVCFSWGCTGGQGGFCFTRPLLHVCHCSTVSCFLLIQGLCSAHLGHVPPLLWTREDVSRVTAKLPGWRPTSHVHVLNH